jgi:hypothetical protein
MNYLNRFKQPSTWAGLGIIAALLGVPPGTFELITQIGLGLAGLAAVVLEEKNA